MKALDWFSLLLTTFFIFSLTIQVSQAYFESGDKTIIRDLESNDLENFNKEAANWTASQLVNPPYKVTYCYNTLILGGYNILYKDQSATTVFPYFRRTYTGLNPNHNAVRFTFFAQPVDSWDAGDTFRIQFDSMEWLDGWEFRTYSTGGTGQLCGSLSFNDYRGLTVAAEFPHTGTTLTITVESRHNQPTNDESFGFRDVKLFFFNHPDPPSSPFLCGIADFALNTSYCECPSTRQYMDPPFSGRCLSCHSTCRSCQGPANTECTSCDHGFYLTATPTGRCLACHATCHTCSQGGTNGCLTCRKGRFLTLIPSNTTIQTCVPSCDPPLIQTANNITDLCSSPCTPPQYAYWDGSCETICDQPLEPLIPSTPHGFYNICSHPCPQEKYLYWNTTCGDTCPYPLTNRTKKAKLFCDYPCSNTNNWLYWDKTCLADCPAPLSKRTEGNPMKRNWCDYPCTNLQFLYWNGTCMPECEFPLIQWTYKGKKFCNFTCSQENKVVYWDGTCQDDCHFPKTLKAEGSLMVRYYCFYKCEIGEFLYWNGTCARVCVPPLTYSYSNGRWFCHYPCAAGQYLRWDGVCQSTCNSPLEIRIEAGNYYCDFPCTSSHPYLYWNGSCMASCDFPLQNSTQGSAFYCNFPCNSATDILYWNGTCSTQCPAPLTLNTEGTPSRKYCEYKCNKETEYLYWNGTCSQSCDFPFVIKAEAGLNYCKYPCTSMQYLYWNGSCMNQCSSPYASRIDSSGAQYCDFPCNSPTTDYLYWNGTCSPYCLDPLTRVVQGSGASLRHLCVWGCPSTIDFLYWNGSCVGSCSHPLIQKVEGGRQFCVPPCNNIFQYYDTDTQTCKNSCPYPYTIDNNRSYARCDPPILNVDTTGWFARHILTAPIESGTTTFIMLTKMMEYIRYLDLRMPPRLLRLSVSQGRSILSHKIGWSMPRSLEEGFPRDALPGVFQRHNMFSSFLVNYWSILTSMAIIVLAAIIFSLLEKAAKAYYYPTWQSIFESLRRVTRWSAFIIVFGTNLDELILYSYLQFKTYSYSSWSDYTVLSFITCIAVLVLVLTPLIAGIVLLGLKTQNSENLAERLKSGSSFSQFVLKWQDFNILFQGFKTNFFINRLFYLLYLLRIAAPMFIVCIFFEYPTLVIIAQTAISLATFTFIVAMRPLQSKINHIQLVIVELSVFAMNIIILIMKIIDNSDVYGSDGMIFLGDLFIVLNIILNFTILVFFVLKFMMKARDIARHLNEKPSIRFGIWLETLSVPLQQSGMGFEEIPSTTIYPTLPNKAQKPNSATFAKLKRRVSDISNRSIQLPGDTIIDDFPRKRALDSSSFHMNLNEGSPKSQIIQRSFGSRETDFGDSGIFQPQRGGLAQKFYPSLVKNYKAFHGVME